MKIRVRATAHALLTIAAFAVPRSDLRAQALPDARTLVERHIAATNARAMIERGSIHTRGTFSVPGMGASGELDILQAAPNRMAMRMAMAGLGDIRSGYDGTVGWSMNPMEGPRLMAGPELLQLRDEADFGVNTRDTSLIAHMETVERIELDGSPCYKVKLDWKSGRSSFDCYDVRSGLLAGTMYTAHTAMGALDAVVLYQEYREFDGVRIATLSTQKVFGQQLVMKIDWARFEPIDPALFELPAEIKALVAAR